MRWRGQKIIFKRSKICVHSTTSRPDLARDFQTFFILFKFRCASHSHELGLGYLNPCKYDTFPWQRESSYVAMIGSHVCMYVTLVGMLTMWMKPVRLKGCDRSRYAEHICCAFAWLRCNTNVCKSSYAQAEPDPNASDGFAAPSINYFFFYTWLASQTNLGGSIPMRFRVVLISIETIRS